MGQRLSRYPEGHHVNSSLYTHSLYLRVPSGAVVKNPPASARDGRDVDSIPESGRSPGGGASAGDGRDVDSIPEPGRSPEGGNGNLLQYSCLENSVDRGASFRSYSSRGHKDSDMTE